MQRFSLPVTEATSQRSNLIVCVCVCVVTQFVANSQGKSLEEIAPPVTAEEEGEDFLSAAAEEEEDPSNLTASTTTGLPSSPQLI